MGNDFANDRSTFDFNLLCKALDVPIRPDFLCVDNFKIDLLSLCQFCFETRIVDPFEFQKYALEISYDNINRAFLSDRIVALMKLGYSLDIAPIIACLSCLYDFEQVAASINSLLVYRNQTQEDTLRMFLLALSVVIDRDDRNRSAQYLIEIELTKIRKNLTL